MDVRNFAGLFLILAGFALIFLRARTKGDIKLEAASGLWGLIAKLGDAVYIIGMAMVVLGVVLIAPDLADVILRPDSTTTTTTAG